LPVIRRDQPAQCDPAECVHAWQDAVQDLAADILEVAVDALRRRILQRTSDILRLVVDAGIESEFDNAVAALLRAAGDPSRAAPRELRKLPDDAADRPARRRYQDRLALLCLDDLLESVPGGDARHTDRAEISR